VTTIRRSITAEVIAVRQQLADALEVDLPVLEQANQARDYATAFARAVALRATRLRVRNQLAGGDPSGELRADWKRVEPRIEAALALAPRPGAEPGTGKSEWLARRLARGTGPHARRVPRVRPR
jgi:hypothetical protein